MNLAHWYNLDQVYFVSNLYFMYPVSIIWSKWFCVFCVFNQMDLLNVIALLRLIYQRINKFSTLIPLRSSLLCVHCFKDYYSGTLECDHPDNLTTLKKRPLFGRPVSVFLYLNHLDKLTTLLIWPLFVRPKSGPIIKVPL